MTVNHINSVLYINRVYYEMILTGALSIQGGDNPRILLERLNSIAGIKVQEEENADILPIDNPESVELFTSYVAANEVIATCTGPSGGYIPVARVLDVAGDSYAGMEFKPGRNTVVSTDTLLVLADINGDVVLKNGIIHVVPLFTVKSDVDITTTGNIVFLGSVFVRGDVKSGVSVKAGGNVYICGRVEDGATVEAEGVLMVKG